MKTRIGRWVRISALTLAVAPLYTVGVIGQDSSAIDAFISGIDNYDEAVITPPVIDGINHKLPSNMLPGNDEADVVIGSPLVPDRPEPTRQPDDRRAIEAPVEDPVDGVRKAAPSYEPVSDYFDNKTVVAIEPTYACNWVLGVSVPIFEREFDDDRLFSFDPADATQILSSDDADPSGTSGIDVTLGRRNSCGRGFEARYWGLYAAAETATLENTPSTAINGLSHINDNGTPLATTFNTADFHELTRDYSFNNVELNLLRNGRTLSPLGRGLYVEWLGGFRYLQFNESLEYAGVSPTNPVIRSALSSNVENRLFGGQMGGRAEWNLFRRTSLSCGGKLGLFNNRARSNIVATNQLPDLTFRRPVISSGPDANTEFEFSDTKDDLSLLGELDLGVIYRMTMRSRLRIGYRLLGVSNIADSETNIPADFTDTTVLQTTNTDSDLTLRGGYVGIDFAY